MTGEWRGCRQCYNRVRVDPGTRLRVAFFQGNRLDGSNIYHQLEVTRTRRVYGPHPTRSDGFTGLSNPDDDDPDDDISDEDASSDNDESDDQDVNLDVPDIVC